MAATHLGKIGGLNSPDGVSPHLNLDAIETLKTLQGIINSYLANSTTEGRREIPTPQLSPVPKFQDVKRDADAMNGGQIEAVRESADHVRDELATQRSNPEEPEALQLGSNGVSTANNTYQPSQGSPAALGTQNGNTTTGTSDGKMAANGPATVTPAGHNIAQNEAQSNTANGKPHTQPDPNQDRLRILADEVTRAVSQSAVDDGARIKAATAALELASVLRPPGDTIMGWFANMSVISAVHLFQNWGVFDLIPTGQGDTITHAELAEKINADEALVARIASMLTASRVLLHHPPPPSASSPSLSHTPTSRLLTSSQPLGAMFSLLYNHINEVSTIFPSYFDTYGRSEPVGPAHVPTTFYAGHPELDHFSMLKRDEKALRNFNLAMRMTSKRVPVTEVYDMSRVLDKAAAEGEGRRETVWVDVGGGDGHTVLEFLRAYPGLRAEQCVVQDLEEVVGVAMEQNQQGMGEGELRGVRWVALDFLREAPVKGALVYYLRHVLRDYSDPVAVTILSQVARALTDPDARILISEQINPDVAGNGPLPLYAAFKDFSMLSIGGKERSVQQFSAIADAAGLRVSGVYRHGPTQHGVVELVLKGTGGGGALEGV